MTTYQQEQASTLAAASARDSGAFAPADKEAMPLWALGLTSLVASMGVVAIALGAWWVYESVGPSGSWKNSHLVFFGLISMAVGAFPVFGAVGYLLVRTREWFVWMLILTVPLVLVVLMTLFL